MQSHLKIFVLAAVLAVGSVAAPALFAQNQQTQPNHGSMMGQGMMGQGMMDQSGMMGMMNMMGQMSQMMDACTQMMRSAAGGSGKPTPEQGG